MNKNSLVSMRDLSKDDMIHILNDALMFSNSQSDWQLPDKALIANLFFEASTRTHYSFESAELQLGCKVADIATNVSSVTKGETLYDTCKTLESAGYNALVIRSSKEFYWNELEGLNIPVLNAGDGANEHPTQCLLDLLTIYKEFHKLEGIKVVICGDVAHSRVAQSDKYAFELFGMDVKFAGPKEFERDYDQDKFKEFFERVIADMTSDDWLLCGLYEKEIAEMFIKAFENSKTYDPESTNEEIEEYTDKIVKQLNNEWTKAKNAFKNSDLKADMGVALGLTVATEIVEDCYNKLLSEKGKGKNELG